MVEGEQEHVGEILSNINTGAIYCIPIVHYNPRYPLYSHACSYDSS